MSQYNTLNHQKFRIRYHLIFSTKYRRKLLEPIHDDILRYMKSAETKDFKIEIDETDKDHIHLLIKATPNISPSKIVHKLKQISTFYVWQEHKEYMKKFYWGKKHHLWTRGYFCSTIGNVSETTIINYIKNQGSDSYSTLKSGIFLA